MFSFTSYIYRVNRFFFWFSVMAIRLYTKCWTGGKETARALWSPGPLPALSASTSWSGAFVCAGRNYPWLRCGLPATICLTSHPTPSRESYEVFQRRYQNTATSDGMIRNIWTSTHSNLILNKNRKKLVECERVNFTFNMDSRPLS